MISFIASLALLSADPTLVEATCTIGFTGGGQPSTSESMPCVVGFDHDETNNVAGVGFFFDETLGVIFVGDRSDEGIAVKVLGSSAPGAEPIEVDSGKCTPAPGRGITCEATVDDMTIKVTAIPLT